MVGNRVALLDLGVNTFTERRAGRKVDLAAGIAADGDKSKTMSRTKHSEKTFTNMETVRKRAWIERALASVRGRFTAGEDGSESIDRPAKPDLYVVDSNRTP